MAVVVAMLAVAAPANAFGPGIGSVNASTPPATNIATKAIRPGTTPVTRETDERLRILVMGDSYSAGNGAVFSGDRDCWRSSENYGELFAEKIHASGEPSPEVKTVACSGAVTDDFDHEQHGEPRQLDAVSTSYDIIFLTVGGNDAYFKDIVRYCLVAKSRDGANCGPNLARAEKMIENGQIERRIRGVLEDIAEQADSKAKIVLLGYPLLEGDANYTLRSGHFGSTFIEVGKRLRALGRSADRVQKNLVKSLNTGKKQFVFQSVLDLFNGPPFHGLYAQKVNPYRWMVQPFKDAKYSSRDTFYHPNPEGWENESKLLFQNGSIPHAPVSTPPVPPCPSARVARQSSSSGRPSPAVVGVQERVPGSIQLQSTLGAAVDDDETDVIRITATDINGDPLPGVQPTVTLQTTTAVGTEVTFPVAGVTDANGKTSVPVSGVDNTCSRLTITADVGGGVASSIVLRSDNSRVVWEDWPTSTRLATTVTQETGVLELPTGEPLPGRVVQLTFLPSNDANADGLQDTMANAVLSPAAYQPPGTQVSDDLHAVATTAADGSFRVGVMDPADPQDNEVGDRLQASSSELQLVPGNEAGLTLTMNFLKTLTPVCFNWQPAELSIDVGGSISVPAPPGTLYYSGLNAYDAAISWGDGSSDAVSMNGRGSHVYQAPGVFTLRITGSGSFGDPATACRDDVTYTVNVRQTTRQITVYNQVTNGATEMREDTPAYLSTVPHNFCRRDGCMVGGTEMGSGKILTAYCVTQGQRTTNGQDNSSVDDANPGLYTSTTWYGIRWETGVTGFLSEVWISPQDRGGLGLPAC
jgi:lysophospholipase L1-like esterase